MTAIDDRRPGTPEEPEPDGPVDVVVEPTGIATARVRPRRVWARRVFWGGAVLLGVTCFYVGLTFAPYVANS